MRNSMVSMETTECLFVRNGLKREKLAGMRKSVRLVELLSSEASLVTNINVKLYHYDYITYSANRLQKFQQV